MKIVARTVVFHIFCILFFSFIYYTFSNHFENLGEDLHNFNGTIRKRTLLDFILFSTTIQAGVGIIDFYPSTTFTKIIVIMQQLIIISTHVFTLYIFTL